MANGTISAQQFTDILIRRAPHFDEEILKDVTPYDSWIGHVETGKFPAGSGVTHTQDRIHQVYPDLTGAWEDFPDSGCLGSPCDPAEKQIGFGYSRDTYSLQRTSYATGLFCYDQQLTADKAKEQMESLIENLREATGTIVSDRIKMEAFRLAGRKWLAKSGCPEFTYSWNADYTIMTPSALPTSKLTARMLQRRVQPQILAGAFHRNVVGAPQMLELVTDMDTAWTLKVSEDDLDDRWQFTEFGQLAEYYKYGWTGKVGNYGVRVDLFPIRFQKLADGTLQRVFPYKNVAATGGIKQEVNEQYDKCIYQLSFIWHRRGMTFLTFDPTSIHPSMPFVVRDMGGKWQFVQDDLGEDADGRAIQNKRRNKGQFIADFAMATKPKYTEFVEAILHLREPASVTEVDITDDTLKTDNYTTQSYDAFNADCAEEPMLFTPTLDSNDEYTIPANSITVNGVPIVHSEVGGTGCDTMAELVADLVSKVAILGTWARVALGTTPETYSTTQIQLTRASTTTTRVELPFAS